MSLNQEKQSAVDFAERVRGNQRKLTGERAAEALRNEHRSETASVSRSALIGAKSDL
jgi:hypothetical protein